VTGVRRSISFDRAFSTVLAIFFSALARSGPADVRLVAANRHRHRRPTLSCTPPVCGAQSPMN
jgi:hypothetical protein